MEKLLQRQKQTCNIFLPLLAVVSMSFFSGCGVADLVQIACDASSGDPHCTQEAAVQSDTVENCDKVAQKEEFKKFGSNPPRDKCVVMVAANTEDPAKCDKVKGGAMSYTKEDCIQAIGDTARDPATCSKLGSGDIATCINKVAEKTFADITKLKDMKSKTKEDITELQNMMNELAKTNELLTSMNKTTYDVQRGVIGNLR
ncbi:hypothetical protein KBC54_04330 [Patescibacteria group bacterium]|nr:hypothetical protein [Patescibacteria group bacterium]